MVVVSRFSKMSTATNLFGAYFMAFVKVIGLGNVSIPRLASETSREHDSKFKARHFKI